jgi:hypothetical protein
VTFTVRRGLSGSDFGSSSKADMRGDLLEAARLQFDFQRVDAA